MPARVFTLPAIVLSVKRESLMTTFNLHTISSLASDYTSQLCMLTFRRITFGHPEVSFSVDVKGVEHGAGTVEGMVQLPTPRCDPN
jgi:hypothetical protein